MRILILTQPLYSNYGCILQNYALQKVLKDMGHEVWTEDRRVRINFVVWSKIFLYNLFVKRKFVIPRFVEYAQRSTSEEFIKQHIKLTVPISHKRKNKLKKYEFKAYIVGSDQVWRKSYSPYIYNYFLDFAIKIKAKKIAYAASFGIDNWEYSDKETEKCSFLLNLFDAVSVREQSGVTLCKKYFGINAKCLVDPTLLLNESDYGRLIVNQSFFSEDIKYCFSYILEKDSSKSSIIDKITTFLHCKNILVPSVSQGRTMNLKSIFTIEKWLYGVKNASVVVTDSFHGCVFSIIFKKPFIALKNKARGLERIESLLNKFGLSYRLIDSIEDLNENMEILLKPLDNESVEKIMKKEQHEAWAFLTNALQ